MAGRSITGVEVAVGVVGADAPEDADFAEWCGLPSLAATFLIPLIVARIVVYRLERCVKTWSVCVGGWRVGVFLFTIEQPCFMRHL